jgi:hypothetical protein
MKHIGLWKGRETMDSQGSNWKEEKESQKAITKFKSFPWREHKNSVSVHQDSIPASYQILIEI